MTVLVVLLTVVVALLTVLVAGLLRSHAEILRSLHDLGAGLEDAPGAEPPTRIAAPGDAPARDTDEVAADITGITPTGEVLAVGVTGARHPTLLAFLTTGCASCMELWRTFERGGDLGAPGGARVVVVTKGPEAESESMVRELAPRDLPVVMSSAAWDDYHVPVAPYFVLVDGPTGLVVGEGAAASWPQLVSVMSQAVADAGLDRLGRSRVATKARADREREARADRELMAAGIHPGHPSLQRLPETDDESTSPPV